MQRVDEMGVARRILIVEDDPSVRASLSLYLEHAGFDVVAVAELRRALELIRRELFDLLVTDLDLPDGTGLELVETARAHRPKLPAILVTGYGCSAIRQRAEDLSLSAYFEKPVDPKKLLETLQGIEVERDQTV